jgi:hypothetical protein
MMVAAVEQKGWFLTNNPTCFQRPLVMSFGRLAIFAIVQYDRKGSRVLPKKATACGFQGNRRPSGRRK